MDFFGLFSHFISVILDILHTMLYSPKLSIAFTMYNLIHVYFFLIIRTYIQNGKHSNGMHGHTNLGFVRPMNQTRDLKRRRIRYYCAYEGSARD